MFTQVKSSRQWDSENEVTEEALHNDEMKTFDFEVNELEPLYRTALQLQARNLSTGRTVWKSARLPEDREERAEILRQARCQLTTRLIFCGIL